MMNKKSIATQILFIFSILSVPSGVLAADLAGKVVFVRGNPTAVDAANAVRTLAKGSEVFTGDKLVSGPGKIQVSMIDGAFISVQPESEFAIENYKYAGTADGTENAAMRLVKGGVRAVTGAIGKDNPEAYKVHTSVATIGIRGTGYNTRLCAGDCPGRTDGLYHNTWEGITYVANNVESRDVPSRNGVFVRDINAPIEILAQVAGVTAIDEGVAIAEEKREEEATSTVVASGEQRNDAGLQVAVTGNAIGSAKVLTGLVGEHFNHNDEDTLGLDFGGLQDMTIFFNAEGQPVGLLFSEDEDNGTPTRGLATIDLNSVLAGDNPAALTEIRGLIALNDPARIAAAQLNQPRVEDFKMMDSVGYFRWTDGDLLLVGDDGDTNDGLLMTANQSVHIIFGPAYTSALPTSGSATYNFFGGTRSTSVSGATIGNGATAGNIAVNFASSTATLNMNVNHLGTFAGPGNYNISGPLTVSRDGGLGLNGAVPAHRNFAPASACSIGCPVLIEGGFPGVIDAGLPVYAGFGYAIMETDPIIGSVVFKK